MNTDNKEQQERPGEKILFCKIASIIDSNKLLGAEDTAGKIEKLLQSELAAAKEQIDELEEELRRMGIGREKARSQRNEYQQRLFELEKQIVNQRLENKSAKQQIDEKQESIEYHAKLAAEWFKECVEYQETIEFLRAQIADLQSSRLKDIEDAFNAGCSWQSDWEYFNELGESFENIKSPNLESYLKQFTDKTQL